MEGETALTTGEVEMIVKGPVFTTIEVGGALLELRKGSPLERGPKLQVRPGSHTGCIFIFGTKPYGILLLAPKLGSDLSRPVF